MTAAELEELREVAREVDGLRGIVTDLDKRFAVSETQRQLERQEMLAAIGRSDAAISAVMSRLDRDAEHSRWSPGAKIAAATSLVTATLSGLAAIVAALTGHLPDTATAAPPPLVHAPLPAPDDTDASVSP